MVKDALKRVHLFHDLPEPELERLAALCRSQEVVESEMVFREGEPATALYITVSGKVALFKDMVGKPLQLLDRLQPGEFFGEMGLFDGALRTASAQASEPGRLLRIERQALLDFLEDRPVLALKLQMAAARRHSANVAAALELGQRRVVRIKINQQVLLVLENSDVRLAVLENLSPVGLCLSRAPSDWQPERLVNFRLRKGGSELEIAGRVAWRRGDAVGIAFTDRSPHQDAKVQAALRRMLHGDPL